MNINSNENYLSLVITALDELIAPEVNSAAAKTAVEMMKTTLNELRKREADAPVVIKTCIVEGRKVLVDMLLCAGEAQPIFKDIGNELHFDSLLLEYQQLTSQLHAVSETLRAEHSGDQVAGLLRRVAEWELSYYTNTATLKVVEAPKFENPRQPLTKSALQDFINSLDEHIGAPVQLDKFESLMGGFGKQTFLCSYKKPDGSTRELVVRKSDPMPIMLHGSCLLDNEHALLCALPKDYPAPKPLAYAAQWQNVDGDFYIMDRSAGEVPGAFLHGMNKEMPEEVFLDLAEMLGQLHSVPLNTFSDYAEKYDAPNILQGTVADSYRANLAGWAGYIQEQEHLPSPYLIWLMNWLETNLPEDTRTPVLVHGDFNIHNVLVNEGRISAILDWECAGFGATEQDLAYIRPHISQHIEWTKFLNHYLAHGGREPDEAMMNYGMVYAALRTNLAGNKATFNLQQGRNRDLRYSMVELGFTPSFMNLALNSAKG